MVAKSYKLPIQEYVGAPGKVARQSALTLKIFPPKKTHSRFGVVISKKVAATAVARNRLKRMVFDFCAALAETIISNDYLIILSPPAARVPKEQLLEELQSVFSHYSIS